MNNDFHCPIKDDLEAETRITQDHSEALVRSFRRLRRLLNSCQRCEYEHDCPFLAGFHALVDQAIQEVVAEWGLDE